MAKSPSVFMKTRFAHSRADLFVQEHQWPETFLDTFVPTEAEISKWVNDEIKRDAAQKAQQDAAQKAQREQEAAQKAQREIEAVRNSKLQTHLLDTGQENHQAHSSNIQERAERLALSENYTTQDNYITEGNAEEPESDKAQTEVEGQPARSTFEPQSRQSDPVAKDRETAQTVTELVEPDVSDEKRALFISKGQKRSFGEMKKGGGLAAWNYGGVGEDKEQRTKRSLKELKTKRAHVEDVETIGLSMRDLTEENYDGDAEEFRLWAELVFLPI
ncbi:hypothetical protein VC83_07622 [Pseudogymnoascus destructans]|uniref:Uncharacterized protein n=1 Tax=Pseudogymnoascus destructans TaxID=655981 RepID=A0A177A004_9PEZI|nr:uncharacterized protein VC83_07622 [Pseudogymnoascus destructans]OAF55615.1 hypothetical protein VC83_07622 [Pseudogymnoascus destructans]